MRSIVTLILALSMLLQSLPGLMQQCAAMPVPADRPANAECACCRIATGKCGAADSASPACNCKAQQSEQPTTPPSSPKQQGVEKALDSVPVLRAVLLFEPATASPWRLYVDQPLWRSGSSAQSILCVWLI